MFYNLCCNVQKGTHLSFKGTVQKYCYEIQVLILHLTRTLLDGSVFLYTAAVVRRPTFRHSFTPMWMYRHRVERSREGKT